jgi:hypothetical protein
LIRFHFVQHPGDERVHASPHHLERQVEDRRDFLTVFAREKMLQD